MTARARAFTLVELLVVIAVSSILLVLIFGPLVQSFNLTNEARAESEAQNTARTVIEQLSTELSNATYVRDNSIPEAAIEVSLPAEYFPPGTPANQQFALLPYAKVDFFPASQGDPSQPLFNPRINRIDPTLLGKGPVGDLNVPLARGASMVRYYVALRHPFDPYTNGHEQRMVQAGRQDNFYCLYRAEIIPVLSDGTVNTQYFEIDQNGTPILDDPSFMLWRSSDGNPKQQRMNNWIRASQIVTHLENMDLITVTRDKKTRDVVFDQNGKPQVIPLISFQPLAVSDEPASPDNTTSLGDESPNKTPTGFTTKSAGWTNGYGIKWYRAAPTSGVIDYYYLQNDWLGGRWQKVMYHAWSQGGNQASEPVFNLTRYQEDLERGTPNLWSAINQGASTEPIAFVADPVSGKITTSIPREHYMPQGSQIPTWSTGNSVSYISDPNPDPTTVNGRLNYLYRKFPLWGRRIERYLRLKDDMDSPLTKWSSVSIVPSSEAVWGPDQRPGPHYGQAIRYRRVPSLDVELGPNQYRINYQKLAYDPAELRRIGFDTNDQDVQKYILPRFEAGYIRFYSDPNYPLPQGTNNIIVTYHLQFNTATDVVTVDYSTKEVMLINLAIKRYERSSGNAHLTSLTNRVHVRNFLK